MPEHSMTFPLLVVAGLGGTAGGVSWEAGRAFDSPGGTASSWLAEEMHKECQATMEGARVPHCRDHSLSWETQRAPACAVKGILVFSVCGLHSQHVSETGLIWGGWRVVLSTDDVKTSAPSDWIAPLQQVLRAEPQSLQSEPINHSKICQPCDWNGYKWKC